MVISLQLIAEDRIGRLVRANDEDAQFDASLNALRSMG